MTASTDSAETRIREVLALEGRDLAAEVLVQVLGWRWYARRSSKYASDMMRTTLFPPEGGEWRGWERFNFYPDFVDVTGREGEYERHSDWWRACGKRYLTNEEWERSGMLRPDKDQRDSALVLAKIDRRGLMERYTKILYALYHEPVQYNALLLRLMVSGSGEQDVYEPRDVRAMLLATPTDQCRAALLTVWGEKGKEEDR